VIKIGENLYNWEVACFKIFSILAYQREFSDDQINKYYSSQRKALLHTQFLNKQLTGEHEDKEKTRDAEKEKTRDAEKEKGEHEALLDCSLSSTSNDAFYYLKKSFFPSKEILAEMKLQPGLNNVVYKIFTSLQGCHELEGRIFFLDQHTKIVISDFDGTITKYSSTISTPRSDILGQWRQLVGADWSHKHLAQLYHNISANGYFFVYLSSRAIGTVSSSAAVSITDSDSSHARLPLQLHAERVQAPKWLLVLQPRPALPVDLSRGGHQAARDLQDPRTARDPERLRH